MKTTKAVWSLKSRMTLMLFALVICLWVLSAVVIYVRADQESQELFDSSISETANLLLFLSDHEMDEVGLSKVAGEDAIHLSKSPHYLAFQLWDAQGVLRYRSVNAPELPLAPLGLNGFSWQHHNDEVTRTYNLQHDKAGLRIIVSEPLKHRQEIAGHFFGSLVVFSLILLPIGFLGVHWLVSKALLPVDDCARQVNKLDVKNLVPVDPSGLPVEIQPLVDGLNAAIERIQASIQREKRFTADAAHELRTPLAGVRANVQLMQLGLGGVAGEQADIMRDAVEGVDRCSRMINQLLALSRSDSETDRQVISEPVDLSMVVKSVLQMEYQYAKQRSIELQVFQPSWVAMQHLAERGRLCAYPTALELMVRNLLNNAIAYSSAGGRVEVRVSHPAEHRDGLMAVRVAVLDDGPGIPLELRPMVFDRFYRINPNQSKGSGLGLAICAEIARLHNTTIEIDAGLDGRGSCFSFSLYER